MARRKSEMTRLGKSVNVQGTEPKSAPKGDRGKGLSGQSNNPFDNNLQVYSQKRRGNNWSSEQGGGWNKWQKQEHVFSKGGGKGSYGGGGGNSIV